VIQENAELKNLLELLINLDFKYVINMKKILKVIYGGIIILTFMSVSYLTEILSCRYIKTSSGPPYPQSTRGHFILERSSWSVKLTTSYLVPSYKRMDIISTFHVLRFSFNALFLLCLMKEQEI
jgi:hypothetical protein